MPHRPHLSSLGRHLHRSVLRVCLPAPLMRELLSTDGAVEAASPVELLRRAESIVAAGGPRADALHAALDRLHADSVQQSESATTRAELETQWRSALHGGRLPGTYWATLTHPQADRTLRHLAFGDVEMLWPDDTEMAPLAALVGRRSVSPRRLAAPGPGGGEIEQMVQAALSAPDHGRLHPWRLIEFRAAQREALAALFEDEKRRRDPLASASDLRRARKHATQAPCLLGFVVSPRQRRRIPAREQWLSAGAALGNLLNAAHQLGYGAIVLSGDRCFDESLCRRLGLVPGESLAGFISLGTMAQQPPEAERALPHAVWGCWMPEAVPAPSRREHLSPTTRRFSDEDIG